MLRCLILVKAVYRKKYVNSNILLRKSNFLCNCILNTIIYGFQQKYLWKTFAKRLHIINNISLHIKIFSIEKVFFNYFKIIPQIWKIFKLFRNNKYNVKYSFLYTYLQACKTLLLIIQPLSDEEFQNLRNPSLYTNNIHIYSRHLHQLD